MKDVVFRARRTQLIIRTYPAILIAILLGGVLRHGLFSFSDFMMCLVGSVVVTIVLAFLPLKNLDIVLSDVALQAPVRIGTRFKSITVNLSDVIVSRNFIDWFQGSQVTTSNGEIIRISAPFYRRKDKQRLMNEVELRKVRGGGGGGDVPQTCPCVAKIKESINSFELEK